MRLTQSLIVLLAFTTYLQAQSSLVEQITFPVKQNEQVLPYPFAGGFNSPQFSTPDLNGDGINDLVVFDRAGYTITTFIRSGVQGDSVFSFAPEYAAAFPDMRYWMLLRDFNQDGAMDIFTAGGVNPDQSVRVFEGYFQGGKLQFSPVSFSFPGCSSCAETHLHYGDQNSGNWYELGISIIGIPVIDDIDGDGDMDILAFEIADGNTLYMYKNTAVESGLPTDSLRFQLSTTCWGNFWDPVTADCSKTLSPVPDSCSGPGLVAAAQSKQLHPGSSIVTINSITPGLKDLLMGGIGNNCICHLKNAGTSSKAWIVEQDPLFPAYDLPVNLFSFPAAFACDTDLDGDEDIIVAPSGSSLVEDQNNIWLYKKSGQEYILQQKDYLISGMIDAGTAAHPLFADVNNDGLQDMIIGNQGRLINQNPKYSTILLYLNTGTTTSPEFTLSDIDWLGMAQFSPDNFDFYPSGADLDADNDTDIVVGSGTGILYYFQNLSEQGTPGQFAPAIVNWQSIDPGISSAACFSDLNGDGLTDMLLGERSGNINLYLNTGTVNSPLFLPDPVTELFGNINTTAAGFPYGNSAPNVLHLKNEEKVIITGSYNGQIKAFSYTTSGQDTFPPFFTDVSTIKPGWRSSASFADIDNDGILEMATGVQTGGVKLFKTDLMIDIPASTSATQAIEMTKISIKPNPARGRIQISSIQPVQWEIKDSTGKTLAHSRKYTGQSEVLTTNWPAGIYFLHSWNEIQVQQTTRFFILPE